MKHRLLLVTFLLSSCSTISIPFERVEIGDSESTVANKLGETPDEEKDISSKVRQWSYWGDCYKAKITFENSTVVSNDYKVDQDCVDSQYANRRARYQAISNNYAERNTSFGSEYLKNTKDEPKRGKCYEPKPWPPYGCSSMCIAGEWTSVCP